MRKLFRKFLIYLLAIGMLMPTWLVTGVLNAQHAKAVELPKNVTVMDDGINTFNKHLHFHWEDAKNGNDIQFYELWLSKDAANESSALDLDTLSSNKWKNIGNVTDYTLSDSEAALLQNGSEYFAKVKAHDSAGNIAVTNSTSWSNGINVVPAATIDYSTTHMTNHDVVATLVPEEEVVVTNNGGSFDHTFIENGSFTFEFNDLDGNPYSVTATVENIDKIAPVIALNGAEEMSIAKDSDFTDPGATAVDDVDGNVTVHDAGVVNTHALGDYTITYSAEDKVGNLTSVERIVHVVGNANTALYNLGTDPKEVVSQDGNLKITDIKTTDGTGTITIEKYSKFPPTGGSIIGIDGFYYNITVTGNISFPINLEISYSDDSSASNYLNENKFGSLYYFDGANWRDYQYDAIPSAVSIDRVNNKITASLQHLTPIVPAIDVVAPSVPVIQNISISGKTISFEWNKVAGADHYKVYLKNKTNGVITATDAPSLTTANSDIVKYQNNVATYGEYYIVVVAVDLAGNESAIPVSQKIVTVSAPVVTQAVAQPAPVTSVAPSKAQAAAPAVEAPAAAADDSNGQIKGDNTSSNSSDDKTNWTPWIVLFVLIILAGAATGGYFYWFNGEDEVKSVVREPNKEVKKVEALPKKEDKKPNNQKKQKRW